MDLGLKKAVDVPMSIIRTANQCWPHLVSLAEYGNISCKSDLQVTSPTPITKVRHQLHTGWMQSLIDWHTGSIA